MSTNFHSLGSRQLCNITIDVFSSILCTKLRKMSYTIIIDSFVSFEFSIGCCTQMSFFGFFFPSVESGCSCYDCSVLDSGSVPVGDCRCVQ